jgi:hypothetical protein
MKNVLWNICELCAAVMGLLVWAPRLWMTDYWVTGSDLDFERSVRQLEDSCAVHRPTLY